MARGNDRTKELHDRGASLARHLEPRAGFGEIAAYLGVSKQRARYITNVALARLADGLQARLQEDPPV